jgi:hypothetical protein
MRLLRIVVASPVIFYNPALLQRVGPQLSAFFIAHEYGHIHGGHTGVALLHDGELSALRQKQELEADCYAAAVLAEQDRDAVDAALRFFSRLGPLRHDNYHPTGSQRAARILSCLPAVEEPARATDARETPSGAETRNVTSEVRAPSARVGGYADEARVWIDEAPVSGEPDGVRHGLDASAHAERDGERRGAGEPAGRRRGRSALAQGLSPALVRQ